MSSRRAVWLLGLAYVGFVSLGLPDGLLGVAWPSIRAQFGLPLDAIGPLLVAITAGYVVASFASGRVLARMNLGSLLAVSCAATAASLAGYATATAWIAMIGFGLVAGLGAGAIDAGLNTYVAMQHSARTLNWLHACYGIGAAVGPLLMTRVLMAGDPWQRGYAIVAAFQIALALCFAVTRSRWPAVTGDALDAKESRAPARATLRLPATWLGMAAFFLAVGLEQSAGAWAYTVLTEARGVPIATAGAWVSGFWAALMGGRLAFGLIANRVGVDALVRAALAGVTMAVMLVAFHPFSRASELGLVLLGFTVAPLFPSWIAATPARLGAAHAAHAVGFQIAVSSLGQALVPWLVGGLAARFGLETIGFFWIGNAIAILAVHELLVRSATVGNPETK